MTTVPHTSGHFFNWYTPTRSACTGVSCSHSDKLCSTRQDVYEYAFMLSLLFGAFFGWHECLTDD